MAAWVGINLQVNVREDWASLDAEELGTLLLLLLLLPLLLAFAVTLLQWEAPRDALLDIRVSMFRVCCSLTR